MSTTVYLNGEFIPLNQAKISPMDRGFLFGDGIYEGICSYEGKLFYLDYHIHRLQTGLRFLELLDYFQDTNWKAIIQTLLEKNKALQGTYFIYQQITRGYSEVRNHIYPEDTTPTVFITVQPFSPQTLENMASKSAITVEDIRWHRCNIKTTSLLGNIKLSNIDINQADKVLLIRENKITEGPSYNFFMVKEGVYYTPPLGHNVLPGITRKILIEIMSKHHLPYEEIEISPQFLAKADEIFITGTTTEITPIIALNGKQVNDGKVGLWTKQLFSLFTELRGF